MVLIPLDRGMIAIVHLCSTSSICRQLAISQNAEIRKLVKFGGFSPPESDKISAQVAI